MTHDTQDPFLKGLEFFCSFFGQSASPESAINGLPLEKGRLTPELFTRAAAKCGLEAKAVRRKLSQISGDTLPALLITKEGVPFILTSRVGDQAEIFSLTTAQGSMWVSWEEVQKNYGGYVVHVRRAFDFEKRAAFTEKEADTKKGHWFWSTLWSFKSFYARVGFATIFINLFAVTSSVFVMTVYDRVVPNQATDTLYVLAIGAGMAFIFDFILKSLRTWFVDSAGHRADLVMGGKLFEQILAMKFADRPASSGALANQARAYEGLREFFTSATLTALIDLPFVFVFAGVVYLLGGIVALPMIIGLVLALLIGATMQLPIQRAVQKSFLASNNRQAIIVESLSGLETIKTACAESSLQSQMEDCVNESAKADTKSRFYSQTAVNSTALIQHLVSVAIIIFAYFQVVDEKMTMGAMIACVLLSGRGMAPVGMVASLLTRLQQSRRSLSGLNQIMNIPTDKATGVGRVFDSANFKPSFSVENISFGFPVGDQGEIPVLKNVNFEIGAGERVGILGKIGSGKSTIIRMLLGLYEPAEGTVKMGGIDIRQLSPAQFRRRIGYVAQDTGLLYGTLRSNLTLAAPWLSEEAIWEGIHRAGLMEMVQSHPAGIDLPIAEGGRSLSGGQRQLVCLARALMLEPEILIFDEPTSAMDPGTEKLFKSSVDKYLAEDERRMLVVATHKRSMLSLVDRLIALDGGKVANDGPKNSVLANKPTVPASNPRMEVAEPPSATKESQVALAS